MNAFKLSILALLLALVYFGADAQDSKKMYPFSKAVKVKAIAYTNVPELRDTAKRLNCGLHLNGRKLDGTSTAYSATLNSEQVDKLSKIFLNTGLNKKTKDNDQWVNFTPRNAFVFLDKEDNVIDYLEICFESEKYRSLSGKDYFGASSADKYDLLETLLKEVKVPVLTGKYDLDHICREFKYNIPDIKESNNDIEIRFTMTSDGGPYYMIKIAENNGKFEAFLYNGDLVVGVNEMGEIDPPILKYEITDHDLDSEMKAIISLGAFTLPAQSVRHDVYFGAYQVNYKNGKDFRSYNFGNPNEFIRKHPDVELYQNYKKLYSRFSALCRSAITQMRKDGDMRYLEEKAQQLPDPRDAEAEKLINQLFGGK